MLNKLLVPVDGTPEAESALTVARALARCVGAHLHLLQVVPEDQRGAAGAPDPVEEAAGSLERLTATLSGDPWLQVTSAVRSGQPATRIMDEVRLADVDLVVMATHGRSGLERAFLGSVAQQILAECPVPVLLQRPGGKRVTTIKTLLVAVDGSPGGALALGAAVALAHPAGARIVVLQVVVPLAVTLSISLAAMAPSYIDPAWDEEALTSAQGYAAGLATRLQGTGIAAEGRAVYGQAVVETLADTADSVAADLIVMSTHALTGPARAMLGSVADAVVRTARYPVLLVRSETAGRLIKQDGAEGNAP